MSIIQIIQHNESIYQLAETPEQPQVSKKGGGGGDTENKYVPYAALRNEIIKSMQKNTKPYGTMGPPKQPKVNPENYLKKGTGKPPMIPRNKDDIYKSKPTEKLPPVPNTSEVLRETKEMIRHVRKNYMAQNAKMATTMAPKIPARRVALTNYGNTTDLSAGLEPRFLTSEYFGKVPPYLDKLIKFKQRMKERKKDMSGIQDPPCVYITCEEREELLKGLKQNWEELQRTYQGLPILTDTIPKMTRKAKIEQELKQLERDITLIEKHPYIYVYNDEDDI